MANYYGYARSNYFKVKDIKKFQETVAEYNVEVIQKGKLVGLLSNSESGWDIATDEDGEAKAELYQVIAKHLSPGHVAILIDIGYEKMRYLSGFAIAVNSKCKIRCVSLNDIYHKAKKLGKHITLAEY